MVFSDWMILTGCRHSQISMYLSIDLTLVVAHKLYGYVCMFSRLCPSQAIHDKMAHQVTRWAQGLSCLANICRTHAQAQYGPKKERPTPLSNFKTIRSVHSNPASMDPIESEPNSRPNQIQFPSQQWICRFMFEQLLHNALLHDVKGRNGYIKVRMWIKSIPSITQVQASYTNLQLRE